MTQLLKHKSVIMCVLNTERRICCFWTLIMHWVTTHNSYFHCSDRLRWSWISQERTACQAAKLTTSALHENSSYRRDENGSALQISPGSAQVSHQLLHSGCCMLVPLPPAGLQCLVPLALCCPAVHPQQSNSGHKHLSDLIFHNYDHWKIKCALCVKHAWEQLN